MNKLELLREIILSLGPKAGVVAGAFYTLSDMAESLAIMEQTLALAMVASITIITGLFIFFVKVPAKIQPPTS